MNVNERLMLHFRSNILAKRKHQCFKCPVVTIHCTQQLMQSFPMKKQHFRKVKKHLHCLVTCCSQISALVIVREPWCGQWYLQRGGERLSRRNFFSYGENFLAFLHDVVCHRNVTFVRHGDFLQHSVCPLILASCKNFNGNLSKPPIRIFRGFIFFWITVVQRKGVIFLSGGWEKWFIGNRLVFTPKSCES